MITTKTELDSSMRRLWSARDAEAKRLAHWRRMTLLFGVLWVLTGLAWLVREGL